MSGNNGKNNESGQPEQPQPAAVKIIAQVALTDDGRIALKSHLLKDSPVELTNYLALALQVASVEAVKQAKPPSKILQLNAGMIAGVRRMFNRR